MASLAADGFSMPSGSTAPWGVGVLATFTSWAAPPETRTNAPLTSSADISIPINARCFTVRSSVQVVCRDYVPGSFGERPLSAFHRLLESVCVTESYLAQLCRAKYLARVTVQGYVRGN